MPGRYGKVISDPTWNSRNMLCGTIFQKPRVCQSLLEACAGCCGYHAEVSQGTWVQGWRGQTLGKNCIGLDLQERLVV